MQTIAVSDLGAPVVTIALARPERLNAMTPAMMDELREVFDGLEARGTRALILTGEGRAFCAGADLKESQLDAEDRGGRVAALMAAHYNPMVLALANAPCPTVAAVNGVAAGGGASLALLADIAIAARSASFVQVFGPRLGLVPDLGATWTLPRAVGAARARGVALLGDPLDAETAAEWGLIWQVVDDGELTSAAAAIAQRLADGPTRAFRAIRAAIAAASGNPLAAQLELERVAQGALARTADFAEGIAAFRAKRRPRFTGR